MASSTENYTALQTIYREQGAADRRAVLQRCVRAYTIGGCYV